MLDMDLVVIVTGIVLTSIGYPLARAIATRMERKGVAGEDVSEIRQRLSNIESAVDAIAIEVERVSEAQRFTTRLLSERASGALERGEGARQPPIPVRGERSY